MFILVSMVLLLFSVLFFSGVGEKLDFIEFIIFEVKEVLFSFDFNKVCGFDNILGFFLKNIVVEIVFFLCKIFNLFLLYGVVFVLWKCVNVIFVFKKDDLILVENY